MAPPPEEALCAWEGGKKTRFARAGIPVCADAGATEMFTSSMPPSVAASIGLAALQAAAALEFLQHVRIVRRVAIAERHITRDGHAADRRRGRNVAERQQRPAQADKRTTSARCGKQDAKHAAICECEADQARQHVHLLKLYVAKRRPD
jgi:hypothetical protein